MSHSVPLFTTEPCSGSDVIHVNILGSHIIILNSMKLANELLKKRSSIYSDSCTTKYYGSICPLESPTSIWVFLPYGHLWHCSCRELQANLRPVDLESYQPIEKRAVHCLLRNLLSSPDDFEQHLRQ
ncbi:hypothetical protein EI94DRAFT_1630986 [Lactarius quietus]|nr:hypothetical protein EI94DRAFT_1630986 [Lactarius quietus]